MPSQQPGENAFVTEHYGTLETQAVQEHNRVHNARKHEMVENHSLASMSTIKFILIFKERKCEQSIGKEGALARHVLGGNRFMPARSPPPSPHPKK